MSYFDAPPSQRVLREFIICRGQNGCWLVQETPNLITRAFDNYQAAERYAIREAEGDYDRIHFPVLSA